MDLNGNIFGPKRNVVNSLLSSINRCYKRLIVLQPNMYLGQLYNLYFGFSWLFL